MDKTILLKFQTIRKCVICKSYLTLEKELESDSVIWYGTTEKNRAIYHKDCLKKKMFTKRGNKLSEVEVGELVDGLCGVGSDSLNHLDRLVYKNHLYLYLMQKYDIITIPNYIFTKMEQIFTGKFKTMSKPIPPEHLLDMFQRKASFLDGIYHKEKLDGVSRINYDLAVLVNKYPSYLDWLGKRESEGKKIVEYTIQNEGIGLTTMIPKNETIKRDEDIFEE